MTMSDTRVAEAAARPTSEEMLFRPVRLGRYELPHRIVMAPLTRSRARQPGNVPGPLNACYYAQRASAALIVSEATQVSMEGQGYAWTPASTAAKDAFRHRPAPPTAPALPRLSWE